MITRVLQLYRKLIDPVIDSEFDYSTIRKVRFLNFTCFISCVISIISIGVLAVYGRYESIPFISLWIILLGVIIYLNLKGKIVYTRYLFLILWLSYATASIHFMKNEAFAEYYLLITILLIFILFDSFWFSLVSFIGLFVLFIDVGETVEFSNQLLRYSALFTIAAFLKKLILEVEKMLKIKHKETLEYELKRVEDQQKLVQAELDFKNQEITTFAVQITKRNEFIKILKERVERIKKENGNKVDLSQIEEIIKTNETIAGDREQFDRYVENVYEGFFSRLGSKYSDISSGEKRLAALLRLELSSKEISTILNISPKSVDMSRYRLRKKMNLENDESLTDTLKSI